MEFTALSDLKQQQRNTNVLVKVSRKWLFRGTTENGPVQHIDMVFTDKYGNAIYAEIPAELAEEKGPLIDENGIYEISRFILRPAKKSYRVVDGDIMLRFTPRTAIDIASDPPSTFPPCVYRLTPFNQIESLLNKTDDFIDVMGIITEVSELKQVHIKGRPTPTVNRDIIIKDLSNETLRVTLWGQQASGFQLDTVYDASKQKPIIILFVGCLAKYFQGIYLSGGAACRWYLNPPIEEAQQYYDRLTSETIELHLPPVPEQPPTASQQPVAEHKNLIELVTADPFEFPSNGYLCTVTITEIDTTKRWWYPSCTKCNRSVSEQGAGYWCSKCNWPGYKFKYKLSFFASDGTTTAEMFSFDRNARQIIGKSCEFMLKSVTPTTPIPPELAQIVSLKFTFSVTATSNSYENTTNVLQIESIVSAHGRQKSLPQINENLDFQGPSTPRKIAPAAISQDSPCTAMQKLSTSASPNI